MSNTSRIVITKRQKKLFITVGIIYLYRRFAQKLRIRPPGKKITFLVFNLSEESSWYEFKLTRQGLVSHLSHTSTKAQIKHIF